LIESTIPELNVEVEHVADLANAYAASARTALPAALAAETLTRAQRDVGRHEGRRLWLDVRACPRQARKNRRLFLTSRGLPRAGAAEALRSFLEPPSLLPGCGSHKP